MEEELFLSYHPPPLSHPLAPFPLYLFPTSHPLPLPSLSLIPRMLEVTMLKKYGPENLAVHYAEFDTICDATQVQNRVFVSHLCCASPTIILALFLFTLLGPLNVIRAFHFTLPSLRSPEASLL